MYTSELCESDFAESPEVFDPINMVVSIGKFILAMLDSIMLFVPVINKSVVGFETIGVNDCISVGFAFNNWHQLTHRAVFDDLGINLIASFEHPENGYFAFSSSPSDPANTTRPEVALIEFDLSVCERTFRFTKLGDTFTKSVVKFINCRARYAHKFRCLFSLYIKAKKTNYLTSFTL